MLIKSKIFKFHFPAKMYSLPCKNFQRIEHNKGIVHFLATKKSTKFSKHRHKHSLILYKGKLIQCFMSQYSFSKSTELEKQNKILKKHAY